MAENTHEKIALDLMDKIATIEKRSWSPDPSAPGWTPPDRAWILRTYAQCLQTIKLPHLVHEHLDIPTG